CGIFVSCPRFTFQAAKRSKAGSSPFSKRFAGLVTFEPSAKPGFIPLRRQFQSLFLPMDGLREVRTFGVGRGEGTQKAGILPAGELTRFGRILDRLLSVPTLCVRMSGPHPGQRMRRRRVG